MGYSSVGLAGLVQGELGLKLPKADRLTDWLARPLPEGAVTYAVADVQHLHELRDRLVAKLEARGRLSWALDECEVHRIRPTSGQVPDRAWWRIKEARSLRGRSAAVAQVLAAWRERRAADLDRPVRFLLPDLALVCDGAATARLRGRPPAGAGPRRRQEARRRRSRAAGGRRPRGGAPARRRAAPAVRGRRPEPTGGRLARRARGRRSEPAISTSTRPSSPPAPTSNRC